MKNEIYRDLPALDARFVPHALLGAPSPFGGAYLYVPRKDEDQKKLLIKFGKAHHDKFLDGIKICKRCNRQIKLCVICLYTAWMSFDKLLFCRDNCGRGLFEDRDWIRWIVVDVG